MFFLDLWLDFFPIDAEGRVGKHVVKFLGIQLVVAEGVAKFDAADVLTLNEHVTLANGVAFRVEFLPECSHHRFGIQLVDIFHAT